MTKQYDQPIKEEIKRISNDREGIKKIVNMAIKAMEDLDSEMDRLNDQRSSLVDIISHFNNLHQVLEGSLLLNSNEVYNLVRRPENIQSMGHYRELALQEADRQANNPKFEGKVTIEGIESYLRSMGDLPWKNPKNAIDTIITRSGKYEKIDTGVWVKK